MSTTARVLSASDEARRRLERDLHDGAQQRFVAAALALRQAQASVRDTHAEPLVAKALEQVQAGLAELRDLARGLYPQTLSERGLHAALESLVLQSPVPVELRVTSERADAAVEAAIYFTVAEALTNVTKHADATVASIEVDIESDAIVASITDDGAGEASPARGSGLRGLADRLAVLGGTLTVESPRGGGTTLRAAVPLRTRQAVDVLGQVQA